MLTGTSSNGTGMSNVRKSAQATTLGSLLDSNSNSTGGNG
jgi:hypothetical protein